ncbi:MAG: hypothetical protein AAGH19_06950 [Pseudomonadota bacterium]
MLEGSVELVGFPDTSSQHPASDTGPGARDLDLLRFPVRNLEGLPVHLEQQGIPIEAMARWPQSPHGVVRGLAVTSPDGAWLEFIEAEDPGP